jgi:hypothetical protein
VGQQAIGDAFLEVSLDVPGLDETAADDRQSFGFGFNVGDLVDHGFLSLGSVKGVSIS